MVRVAHPDAAATRGGPKKTSAAAAAASAGKAKTPKIASSKKGASLAVNGNPKQKSKTRRQASAGAREQLLTLEPLKRRVLEIANGVIDDYARDERIMDATRGGRRPLDKKALLKPRVHKLALRRGAMRLIAHLVQRHIMSELIDGYAFSLARAPPTVSGAAAAAAGQPQPKKKKKNGPSLTQKDMHVLGMFRSKPPLY